MKDKKEIISILDNGGIGVLATDTLYGLVGQAKRPETVSRIYDLKSRDQKKPLIILISDQSDLENFGIDLNPKMKEVINSFWPGSVSIILPCPKDNFKYLHRGTETLAFRLPDSSALRALLSQTGPLVAPSANQEGLPPANTIQEARNYFKEKVDFYLEAGRKAGRPSTLISLDSDGKVNLIRGELPEGVIK